MLLHPFLNRLAVMHTQIIENQELPQNALLDSKLSDSGGRCK